MNSLCIIFSEILSILNVMLLKHFTVHQWAVYIKPDIRVYKSTRYDILNSSGISLDF